MQVEGASRDAVELLEPALTVAPEAFDPVDVVRATNKLIFAMMNSEVLRVSDINQAIVTAPAVRVDDGVERDAPANNGLQSRLFAVGHDLRVNAAISLEDAEDDSLAGSAAPAFAANTTRAEVRLIHFDLARNKGRCSLTFFSNPFSDFEKDRSHAAARQLGQLSRMTSGQIKREVAHKLTKFSLTNFRPLIIAV